MTKDCSHILKEQAIDFETGDIFILYTDGITEAHNGPYSTSELWGIENLIETIQRSPSKTAQGVFNHITIGLSRWMGYHHKQFDDITLIVGQYRGRESSLSQESTTLSPEFITEWKWR